MKILRNAISMLALCSTLLSSAQAQEKYSKVSIPLNSAQVRNFAINNLSLDHYKAEDNAVEVVLNSEEMSILRQSGYSFELIIDDVVANTIALNSQITPQNSFAPIHGTAGQKIASLIATPAAFGLGGSLRLGAAAGNPGYYTYAEMSAKMLDLANSYPTLVTRYSIGLSDGGLPIYGVKISDNVTTDENEPEILYTGLQHAREAIGGTSLMFFMQYLAENYATDARIQALVNNREIFIIPCSNPDGYTFNYGGSSASYPVTGGGLWRKNRRVTGGNGGSTTYGVDMNRNYSVDFGNCAGASTSCGSTSKSSDTYFGPSAFSEKETQAIRDFVYSRQFVCAIDQHCQGAYYSLPYGRPTLHPALSTEDANFYTRIPALMGTYNGHRAGNSPETVNYEVAGGIKDWLLLGDLGVGSKGKIFGMTGEAGGGQFWAPVSMIIQLCKENCYQNLQLAYAAGSYYETQDLNDIAVNTTTGKFSFSLRRIGLGTNPVTVSLIPLENIATNGAPVVKTAPGYYTSITDSISYQLPVDIQPGQKLKFVWSATAGGITTYDTVVKFYQPTILFTDDTEGTFSDKWTATISPSGPAGWNYSDDYAYSGSKSLSESPGANYTTSSTRILTCKTVFDLANASNAYLSFWTRYKAENFRDKLQVQASTDGTTWVALANQFTVAEDNTTSGGSLNGQPALTGIMKEWTRMLFNLDDYKTYSTVQLRFVFTSDNDASSFAFKLDEGFNIDDVTVVKGTSLAVLPVAIQSFKANLKADQTVQLDWQAATSTQHSHFIVEASSDIEPVFKTIATVYEGMAFTALDIDPVYGNNYYRLRQVDKDGTYTYSKTIKINLNKNYGITFFPNPAQDVLTVKLKDAGTNKMLKLQIFDTHGKMVMTKDVVTETGYTEIILNVGKLSSQTYILKLTDSSGQIVHSGKFFKQ